MPLTANTERHQKKICKQVFGYRFHNTTTSHAKLTKALFCQARCREMSMRQAVSLVLNQILKMKCNDEPMISTCSFFGRKPNLLVPSCSVKLAPCHFSHCSLP